LADLLAENAMGDGINIAARLQSVATPGGICISEQAYWQVKGRLSLKVSDLGAMQLKNIAEPIRVYSLKVGQPAEAKPTPLAQEKPAPPRRSLVVLPFANIGGDPEQEHFVDGVTESLTTDLSQRSARAAIAGASASSLSTPRRETTRGPNGSISRLLISSICRTKSSRGRQRAER
jgi:hypothetical protein